MKWVIKQADPKDIQNLTRHLNCSENLARLLIHRNFKDPVEAHRFLYQSLKDLPEPWLMKGMETAVTHILAAIHDREKIAIYGDYDVDGTTGTALLLHFFKKIGYPITYYIPHRSEGYSLNKTALEKLRGDGVALVITVDNGISAVSESKIAKDLGLGLIITDHHQPPDVLPEAIAILNPHQKDCPFPAKEICGTGVAFYLCLALRQRLRENGFFKDAEPNLKEFLDLVALATVADVVPLRGVNRIFVRKGLEQMQKTIWPGLTALIQVSGIESSLTSTHLGYALGPRINACGRMADPRVGVELLTCENLSQARIYAEEANRSNVERRKVEDEILNQALLMITNDFAQILYKEDWHAGVLGIVASRLVERTHRPVILLTRDGDFLKGSARSFAGLNLVQALTECKEHLYKYGGHKQAAGLSLYPTSLEAFKLQFESIVRRYLKPEDLEPNLYVDHELSLEEIEDNLLTELKILEPYGETNPAPLFSLRNSKARNGKVVGLKHLRFQLEGGQSGLSAIAFGKGAAVNQLQGPIDLAFSIEENHFRGNTQLQLKIRDLKSSNSLK